MTKEKKQVKLASIPMLNVANFFYGNRFARKSIKLIDDGSLAKIKPPYLLFSTHSSRADVFSVVHMMLPKTAPSFVMSYTQYTVWGGIVKKIGAIFKKQFSTDFNLIKDIRSVLDRGRPFLLYPEAKFSVDGCSSYLPSSCAKLAKMMKVPLVVIKFDGAYLHNPKWAVAPRYLPVVPTVTVVATAEELATMSYNEIYQRVASAMKYDDYQWQRDNKVSIKHKKLVHGLECVLHQCPKCGKRYAMTSKGDTLTCSECGYSSTMDEFGVLSGQFDSVPKWYQWQKENMSKLIGEGKYSVNCEGKLLLQKGRRYVSLGKATITHNDSGITIKHKKGEIAVPNGLYPTMSFRNHEVFLPVGEQLYRFVKLGKGMSVDINMATEHYFTESVSRLQQPELNK